MAYQNVGRPRIYLNIAEFLAFHGKFFIHHIFRTLPVDPKYHGTAGDNSDAIPIPDLEEHGIEFGNKKFLALLGLDRNQKVTLGTLFDINDYIDGGIMNADQLRSGYSIGIVERFPDMFAWGYVGSVVLGLYYDFPTSPDLNLSISYEYDGVTELTSKGGITITNSNYTGAALWGDKGAWELGDANTISRSGRRVWNISFSYMADDEVFAENSALTNENHPDDFTTLLRSDTLQRAIHFTYGGQLPMIFQPDIDNNKEFAIARFDQKSFNFTQTAPNIYSISLKIREIW